jgi:hypothetical protein
MMWRGNVWAETGKLLLDWMRDDPPKTRKYFVPATGDLLFAPGVGEIMFFQVHSDGEKGGRDGHFQQSRPDGVIMQAERGIEKPRRGPNKPYPIKISPHSLVGCLRLFPRFGS